MSDAPTAQARAFSASDATEELTGTNRSVLRGFATSGPLRRGRHQQTVDNGEHKGSRSDSLSEWFAGELTSTRLHFDHVWRGRVHASAGGPSMPALNLHTRPI